VIKFSFIAWLQGRGFNTGVILMDLKALQELDWQQMWTDVAKKYLKSHKYTQLADQVSTLLACLEQIVNDAHVQTMAEEKTM
jgi:hypothetical protein